MIDKKKLNSGTLYVVGTPIGNLEDITLRAIRVLKSADLIAAEDTRHTAKLLNYFKITTPKISYHQHNYVIRQDELVSKLEQGNIIALVSDAGMPGISDPGYDLICSCIIKNIPVVPVPGPTAVITALITSGLPSDRFVFEGFLPIKAQARQERLNLLKKESRTIIIYESPHRLLKTLINFIEIFGDDHRITIGRELTKYYEEFWRGNLKEAVLHYKEVKNIKGEFTLVLSGCSQNNLLDLNIEQVKCEFLKLLDKGMTRSQASKYLATTVNFSRRQIYEMSLSD
ncbi:16S rRNA (cytidine(1402)-2'-O)-methyltransferase [Candidatus Atelocyanobacterium thalassae]|uniref:Ribosomal RNA small subunit methyltransferase I n=1 Tax=cyanobacterium endosymbiont of Braarudosphaera bigelowii TaxID=1285375 RepID=A0ABN6K3C0_9CHRO|nr:16S rRNA (cytidine(1402)-2'-O)-methyltransferase [Candidatus Atelocyanobacterium thalassa]BDA39725.1 ribosomal RNA small subunit methyltransferase I [cyanobacterium endosymbiont of Braarudosphaera bigelowii]